MTPFYERDGITIYCGDCLEILPKLKGIDLLCADPPYGANVNTAYKSSQRGALAQCNDFPPVYGDDKPFNPTHLLKYPKIILWGANYYADKLPTNNGWLVWDKRDGLESKREDGTFNDNSEVELAWTNITGATRIFSHRWMGTMKASQQQEQRVHPTQKPIALMIWCIRLANSQGIICDPYMGSGPTLSAAHRLNRRAIGIEISEDYCRIAVDRLRQPSFFSLPNREPVAKPEQVSLF